MTSQFDRCHPAPGVKVIGVPGMSVAHLSGAQQRLARASVLDDKGRIRPSIAMLGVLKIHRLGGPVGLGMPSTAHCSVSLYKTLPTRGLSGVAKTPGQKHYRGKTKPGPTNPVFQNRIPSKVEMRRAEMTRQCNRVKELHSRVGNSQLALDKYIAIRANFLAAFPECATHLARVEQLHRGRAKAADATR